MISNRYFRIKKNGEPYFDCYCRKPEFIENYDKAVSDTSQIWEVHHRKEGLYSYKELIERGEYYDVPPSELIFLTHKEHSKIDSRCKRIGKALKGKNHSEETKRKMSEVRKGKFINREDLSKKVLCIETGEIFDSAHDAYRKTGISRGSISMACNGKLKTAGGYHWKFYN